MFNDNDLAAASIAQIFGSELLKVQQNATTDSGHQPDILKLDPKQFLTNAPRYQSAKKDEERRFVEMLQREAEASCPLPQEHYTPQTIPATLPPQSAIPTGTSPVFDSIPSTGSLQLAVLERIARSLEKIANAVDKVDVKVKKKTVKRKIKSSKPILLNETHA